MENREEIIELLVNEMGMTVEEAEKEYEASYGGNSTGSPKIPFPLAKVNNTAGIAPMGALVFDAERDEDNEVIGYKEVHNFEDIDFIILTKHAMYNCYDAMSSKVVAKTCLADVYQAAGKYVDVISGNSLEKTKDARGKSITVVSGTDLEMKYQVLALVGFKPKGSNESLTFVNMYLKGAILFGLNKLSDAVSSDNVLMNIVTKTNKMGSVKYTAIDLDNSEAIELPKEVFTANLKGILTANKTHREYVEALNAFYINGSDHDVTGTAKEATELPS